MKRSILLSIGWLASGVAVVAALWYFEMHWNFFNFDAKWDVEALGYGVLGLLALVGSCFLARASRGRATWIVSLIVCIVLVALGVLVCRPEPVTDGFLGRDAPSPIWFRGGMAVATLLPMLFWLTWPFRSWRRRAQLDDGEQPSTGRAVSSGGP